MIKLVEVFKDRNLGVGNNFTVREVYINPAHVVCLYDDPSMILNLREGYLPKDAFGELPDDCQVIWMPDNETYGCNTIGLPGNKVLVAKGYPTVEETLRNIGLETITLDFSEIRAADGSLTCCSLFY